MSERLVRVTVHVPAGDGEEARADALEVAPEGFEESLHDGILRLGFYVGEDRVDAILAAFGAAETEAVAAGWEEAWRDFIDRCRSRESGSGRPGTSPPGQPAVVIDPGRAFGTGAHATTRLCIELLARIPHGSLLDVGCGSGVLSIAELASATARSSLWMTILSRSRRLVPTPRSTVLASTPACSTRRRRRCRVQTSRSRTSCSVPSSRRCAIDAGHVVTSGYRAERAARRTGMAPARGWRSQRLGGRSFVRATD